MMHPAETVVRRKLGTGSNDAGVGGSSSTLSGLIASTEKTEKMQETIVNTEPDFQHMNLLTFCLAPPFLIMLAFGGRPSILVVCFGTIVTYIFDLLGAMEV